MRVGNMDGHIQIEERVADSYGLWEDLWIKNHNFMALLYGEII